MAHALVQGAVSSQARRRGGVLTCPACDALGIFEHSVVVPTAALHGARSLEDLRWLSQCDACAAVFSRSGPRDLTIAYATPPPNWGPLVWFRPPWVADSIEAAFELSWDLAEHYFARLGRSLAWAAFVPGFLTDLRRAGYGPRLRAGQSVSALVLSRAREHGLRDGQRYIRLLPCADAAFAIEAELHTGTIHRRDVLPIAAGWLAEALDALVATPID